LDYIVEQCPEDTIAIVHDDDLDLIKDVEILTADAVEKFLHENQIPVLTENGAAIIRDPEEGPPVPEEEKATFVATSELGGESVPLIVHPALTKYHLKLGVSEPFNHDYQLPIEELTSPAVHPPMKSLKLENKLYPQPISIQTWDDSSATAVTVQDVLRTIDEDMRQSLPMNEWKRLSKDDRAEVLTSFKQRCKSEEERGKGICKLDHLRGRNRLEIVSGHSPDGV